MEKQDVVTKLSAILADGQRESGYPDADGIGPDTCPLDGLEGFDSELIPPTVRRLARELGRPLPPKARIKNIFVSADGTRKLTIEEIAGRYLAAYAPEACKT